MVKETKFYDTLGVCTPHALRNTLYCCRDDTDCRYQ